VRQEGRSQAQRGDRGVVDAEVDEVLPEAGGGLKSDSKGNKDIVLPGTYVPDPVNERK